MSTFNRFIDTLFGANDRNKLVIVKPRPLPSGRAAVQRSFLPLWRERLWKQDGSKFSGYYRTPHGAYQGEIIEHFSGSRTFFIIAPPDCLQNHSHKNCFIKKGGNKYEIHFAQSGKTIDDGIMVIERILCEAHEGRS